MEKVRLCFVLICVLPLLSLTYCSEQNISQTFSIHKNEEQTILFESLEIFFPKYSIIEDTKITINRNPKKSVDLPEQVKAVSSEFFLEHNTQIKKPLLIRYTFSPSLLENEQDSTHFYFAVLQDKEWKKVKNSLINIAEHTIIMEIKDIERFICLYSEHEHSSTIAVKPLTKVDYSVCLSDNMTDKDVSFNSLYKPTAVFLKLHDPLSGIEQIMNTYLQDLELFAIQSVEEKSRIMSLINDKFNSFSHKSDNQYLKVNFNLSFTSGDGKKNYVQKEFTESVKQRDREKTLEILAENIVNWMFLKKNEYYSIEISLLLQDIDVFLSRFSFPLEFELNMAGSSKALNMDEIYQRTFYLCIPVKNDLPAKYAYIYSEVATMSIELAEKEQEAVPETGNKATMERISYRGNELKDFAESLILPDSEFPGDLQGIAGQFIRETPYPDPSPLSKANFIENGYIGAMIHGLENSEYDVKSNKHQPLVMIYQACIFITASGADKVLESIKTDITKEQLAASFMLERYIGIILDIKPLTHAYGDNSYSFIINGRLDKKEMQLDFTSTIIIFRIGPILTVLNSLSIGEFKLDEIEKLIYSLEEKISTALGS